MYGTIVSLSILAAALVAEKIVRKEGKDPDILWGGLFYTVVAGIIGARIYYVIEHWHIYATAPLAIFQIWRGGIRLVGALTGGIAALTLYLKSKKESSAPWLDIAAIVVPLAQSLGRWANFFNQELFGKPTNLPWGIYIRPENRPQIFMNFSRFHPLFLYEAVLTLSLFVLLCILYSKKSRLVGTKLFFYLYLCGYAIIRFSLEGMRTESWSVAGINVVKAICAVVILVCAPKAIAVVKSKRH